MQNIIIPKRCKKASKPVDISNSSALFKVKAEAKHMIKMCEVPLGRYKRALALAHCQVNQNDPLRFFVTNNGRIIINPTFKSITNVSTNETEGCYSYAFRPEVKMKRWNNIVVTYYEIFKNGKLSKKRIEEFDGLLARVFQHEIDHMDGKAIYY